MDRAPGLSVRLKLTLSYAGFLMVAGALLLAAVWVFLLRYVPDRGSRRAGVSTPGVFPAARTSYTASLRGRPSCWCSCSCSDCVGGWFLAGRMLAPLDRITEATRMAGDRIAVPPDRAAKAATTSSANSPTRSTTCSPASKRRSPSSSGSPPTPPTSCAPRWRSRRRCSTSPGMIRPRRRRAHRPPPRGQHPRDRPDRGAAPAQPCRPAVLHAGAGRPVAPRRGSHRDAPAPRRAARHHRRDHRRHGADRRLTGAAAAAHDEPRAQRHRAQRPEAGTVWVTTGSAPRRVAHVENTGRELTSEVVRHAHRALPARDERVRTEHAGVGLGLAIVESIARAHDGTLTLTPRAAGGLCVTVRLPRRTPPTASI